MKHIDNLFKEKLYNQEVPVPEGMWEKIAPIAEEETGRAMLWFWFAGLLTLLIGGYGIYKMLSTTTNDTPDPSTLVYNEQLPSESLTNEVLEPIVIDRNEEAEILKETSIEKVEKSEAQPTLGVKKSEPLAARTSTPTLGNNVKQIAKSSINNIVENIPDVGGQPANLVITKSYVNKEGAIITQSNLKAGLFNEDPVYDVIINSEAKDINAGALLRIVEPLENIPLPSFQKPLKKKVLSITF
ncbi:MAG: hypothetical protein P1U56_08440 [Saprospiraceae bacterium]|nr:hypothetical protein [Saprospiraceae bacterium]